MQNLVLFSTFGSLTSAPGAPVHKTHKFLVDGPAPLDKY